VSSETLSQNEIDKLLGGSGPAKQKPVAQRASPDVQIYDFRRPHRVSKERLRTLEAIYERLVKSLEGWLMGRVRGQVDLRLLSVEQLSFGEFTLSLPTPCASYIFDVRDTGGQQGVIDFGHEFAYYLVDRLFGGGTGPTVPNRAMTPIERMAIRTVADRVTTLLAEVWQDHVSFNLELSGFESIPEILRIANREDPVLVANIEAVAGEVNSLLILCLPFSVLEKFFSGGAHARINNVTGSERERELNREVSESSLRATRVPISARLPEFQLSMRDISALRVGGVLATGIPCDAELEVRVGEQPRFRAAAGRVGRKLAVRVLDPLAPAQQPEILPSTPERTA
jgi:flagellar motor switch protein FliM